MNPSGSSFVNPWTTHRDTAMLSVPREMYDRESNFVDLRNITTDTPSVTQSALGKRHLEADASLALVGNLLQKQSEMQQRLLKNQQGDRVRSATSCHHGPGRW
tara:strand:+ start:243 stop:551 length:309 start_codon:yes stop_codon:yes gene_type:complete